MEVNIKKMEKTKQVMGNPELGSSDFLTKL
jgi:hypothetical protein